MSKVDALRAAPFRMTQWADVLAMIQAPMIGEPHWATEYDAIRYRLAALAYSGDPTSSPGAMTGTDITIVTYKGTGPLTNDVVGGHVMVAFNTLPPAIGHIQAGKLRAIAV